MTIVAAADGSALGNPGPAGWAWYVDDHHWSAGGWPHGTNNQGELKAVLDLFQTTAPLGEDLHVLCDSQYVINSVTKWMPGWKRKGWRKADGSAVQNLDLLKQLDAAIAGREYRFEWVKGHAGHPLNEAADDRARAVATAYQSGGDIPTGPGWGGSRAESDAAPRAVPLTAVEQVVADEQRLLDQAVRADVGEVASLLHPDFEEIGASGRLWSRDAMLHSIGANSETDTEFELIATDTVSPGAILITYATRGRRGRVLRSSLWVHGDGRWRLRFHQGTAEES